MEKFVQESKILVIANYIRNRMTKCMLFWNSSNNKRYIMIELMNTNFLFNMNVFIVFHELTISCNFFIFFLVVLISLFKNQQK